MKRPLLALVLLTTIYASLAFLVLPQAAFFSSDEGLKLIQVQNLAAKRWSDFALDYPGREIDPELNYVPINNPPAFIRESQVYSVYPVFFPLLVSPLFMLLGYPGLYVIPVASGLLTLLAAHWLARASGDSDASVILVLGLCTPLLFYSLSFWDHAPGTLLVTVALLLASLSLRRPHWALPLASGVTVGVSVWARTELYVMSLVLPVAYFLFNGRRARRTLLMCLGILIALLPLWLFQFMIYGNPVGPHVSHLASLGEQLPVTTSRLAILYYSLLESNSDLVFTFLFVVAFAAATMVLWRPKLWNNNVLVATVFGALLLSCIPNLLQAWSGRPLGGLIATTPFLAFSFVATSGAMIRNTHRLLFSVCVVYIALVCIATPVDPGLQWGPRFLLPIFPPAVVLALANARRFSVEARRTSTSRLISACFAATLAISLLFQASGIRVMNTIRSRDRQLIESTASLDSSWVVSDEYGFAQYVAPIFYQKHFFYVRNQEQYGRLTETFLGNDIHVFAVVTYPVPHRNVVHPLIASEGHTVKRVGHQLFEIEELHETP